MSVDALFVSPGLYQIANRRLIVDFARQSRLPDPYAFREAVELGALMSYGADVPDLLRRSAGYVDKILKGTKPADLPIEQPTKFELAVNLKTASAIGMTIPPTLLLRAGLHRILPKLAYRGQGVCGMHARDLCQVRAGVRDPENRG